MRPPVIITTPFPSVEEVGARSGLSKDDMRYIESLAQRVQVKKLDATVHLRHSSGVSKRSANPSKKNAKKAAPKKFSK